MIDYINLLRSGERSLRAELSRILALATVYGEDNVHKAVIELLGKGIIGVASLEVTLKAHHHPSRTQLAPSPIKFENEKLNRVVPAIDLRRYDVLILESIKKSSTSDKDTENGKNNDG